jgi:hypothetical protein
MSEKVRIVTAFNSAKQIPNSTEVKDRSRGIMKWGAGNDYPLYLIDLLNGSATHGGIVKGKVNYIAGQGLKVVSGALEEFIQQPFNEDMDMTDIVMAMAEDLEVFGMMAVKGTWNMTGERVAKWEYIDQSALRVTEDKKYWKYSNDWAASRQDESTGYKTYPAYDKENRVGSFIIVWTLPYKKGRGEKGYYGKPPYISCVTDIDTERQISIFHRNNIYNAFKLGTLVTFADGMPESHEEGVKIAKQLRDDAGAMDNAGGIKVTFSNGKDTAPIVQSLTGDDLPERYLQTAQFVETNIVKGHSAVSGLLFGIKTEGQLGGATEMEEAFRMLRQSYIESRQKFITKAVNEMVELSGFIGEVEVLGSEYAATPQVEQAKIQAPEEFTQVDPVIEEFKKVGRPKKDIQLYYSAKVGNETNVQEFERECFDTIGTLIARLSDYDKNVLSLVKDKQDGSSIAQATETKIQDVAESLERLRKSGLLTKYNRVTELGSDLLNKSEIPIDEFEVFYSYEVRPDVPAAKQSREFCKFLIDRDMLYTRQEIETISQRVDRDVWRYRGGFYSNPKTGDTTPWCRHFWQLNLVKK